MAQGDSVAVVRSVMWRRRRPGDLPSFDALVAVWEPRLARWSVEACGMRDGVCLELPGRERCYCEELDGGEWLRA